MQVKLLEVRDRATFIPVICIDMNPELARVPDLESMLKQKYLLRRCGYPCNGYPNIALGYLRADGEPFWNDPYGWSDGSRTIRVAHDYIIDHWEELKDGDVVDVEFILEETTEKKVSEAKS